MFQKSTNGSKAKPFKLIMIGLAVCCVSFGLYSLNSRQVLIPNLSLENLLGEEPQIDFENKVAPAIRNGMNINMLNLRAAYNLVFDAPNPDNMSEFFAETATFNAHMAKLAPEDYEKLKKTRQDLKVVGFSLTNAIQDVALMSDSVKNNLKRSVRKLKLRQKYTDDDTKELKPSSDMKIWKYEVKTMMSDLINSNERSTAIANSFEKYFMQSVSLRDMLQETYAHIKSDLSKKVSAQKAHIKELEAQTSGDCMLWDSVKAPCSWMFWKKTKSTSRKTLESEKKNLQVEIDLLRNADDKLTALNDMKLEKPELRSISEAKASLTQVQTLLSQDDAEFTDQDFVDTFTKDLMKQFDLLDQFCDFVAKECTQTKQALDKALIYGKN